ncbi:MAG: M15 family metallopeptidase [Magnetococcales bacterium]|nr:M15 family metallopeptidase [Magnetococcales bacterium]
MNIQSLLTSPPFDDALHLQRFLKGLGYYSGALDGTIGPLSKAGLVRQQEVSAGIAEAFGSFDARSEREIVTLHPEVQRLCRGFLAALRTARIDARVLCGMRSYAQQDALYRQGRTAPGRIVTRAAGGRSLHNFGLAFDIGLFAGGKYLENTLPYQDAAGIGKRMGLDCGAFWTTFVDLPHYQLNHLPTLTLIRKRFEAGFPLLQPSPGEKS